MQFNKNLNRSRVNQLIKPNNATREQGEHVSRQTQTIGMSNSKMSKMLKTFQELYEEIIGDGDGEHEQDEVYFQVKIDELISKGFILKAHNDDFTTYYIINEGITRVDCRTSYAKIDICETQLSILLQLIENNDTFFIFKNTQSGKSGIMIKELIKWYCEEKYAVVPFLVLTNYKDMATQTVDRIKKSFAEQGKHIKIFELSSSGIKKKEEIIIKEIKDACVLWAGDKINNPMPIICLLDNDIQQKKMLKILKYIRDFVVNNRDHNKIRYGVIWDEADKTYARARNEKFTLKNGEEVSCKMFMVDNTEALYRLGFASATDGTLLSMDGDKVNYPECAGAVNYYDDAMEDNPHYRAIHLPGAIIHNIKSTPKEKLNSFAERVLAENAEHFKTPEHLPTGEENQRKTIINGNVSVADMAKFATEHSKKGFYVIVYNSSGGAGLKLYKNGSLFRNYNLKDYSVNERLFYIYKTQNLCDKPLIVIGGLKINRGITFHYCPCKEETIKGEDGDITTKNKEGLVFTDMISGDIGDDSTAVQKQGRPSGNIGDSPQYSGETHYWGVESTTEKVINHNKLMDMINKDMGMEAILDKKNRILEECNAALPKRPKVNHRVPANLFRVYKGDDEADMRNVVYKLYGRKKNRKFQENANGFLLSSITQNIKKKGTIAELCYAIKEVPGTAGLKHKAAGKSASPRVWACYKDTTDISSLHFVVLVDPEKVTEQKLKIIDTEYPNHITIPEEGDF